jgi:hypothetical protein
VGNLTRWDDNTHLELQEIYSEGKRRMEMALLFDTALLDFRVPL